MLSPSSSWSCRGFAGVLGLAGAELVGIRIRLRRCPRPRSGCPRRRPAGPLGVGMLSSSLSVSYASGMSSPTVGADNVGMPSPPLSRPAKVAVDAVLETASGMPSSLGPKIIVQIHPSSRVVARPAVVAAARPFGAGEVVAVVAVRQGDAPAVAGHAAVPEAVAVHVHAGVDVVADAVRVGGAGCVAPSRMSRMPSPSSRRHDAEDRVQAQASSSTSDQPSLSSSSSVALQMLSPSLLGPSLNSSQVPLLQSSQPSGSLSPPGTGPRRRCR